MSAEQKLLESLQKYKGEQLGSIEVVGQTLDLEAKEEESKTKALTRILEYVASTKVWAPLVISSWEEAIKEIHSIHNSTPESNLENPADIDKALSSFFQGSVAIKLLEMKYEDQEGYLMLTSLRWREGKREGRLFFLPSEGTYRDHGTISYFYRPEVRIADQLDLGQVWDTEQSRQYQDDNIIEKIVSDKDLYTGVLREISGLIEKATPYVPLIASRLPDFIQRGEKAEQEVGNAQKLISTLERTISQLG